MHRCAPRFVLLASLLGLAFGYGEAETQQAGSPLFMRAARSVGTPTLSITQDSAGFVWLGTYQGLIRTDGRDYREVAHREVPVIVSALLTDRDGRIWIGTPLGLDRLDPATGEVAHFRHDPDDSRSLSHDGVSALLEDREGRIWVGTLDWPTERGGLNLFEPATGTFRRFLHDPDDPATLSHDRVRTLAEARDGTIWVGTWHGLNQLAPGTGRVRRWLHDPDDAASLSYDDVKALRPTGDGRLWVGTLGGGLDRLDPRTGVFEHWRQRAGDEASLPSDYVMALGADGLGRLWVGTMDGGVAVVDELDGEVTRIDPEDFLDAGGRLRRVEALHLSRDEVLWIAGVHPELHTGLLATVDLAAPRIEAFETGAAPLAVEVGEEGVVWVLLAGGRVQRWDPGSGGVRELRCAAAGDEAPMAAGGALVIDTSGTVWVGTLGAGICRIDASGRSIVPLAQRGEGPPPPRHVGALVPGPEGRIWLAHDEGVYLLDPETGRLEPAPFPIPRDHARLLAGWSEGGAREVWLETLGGMLRYGPGDSLPRVYAPPDADGLEPPLLFVTRVARDRSGTLWASREVGGLCRLDADGPSCRGGGVGEDLQGALGVYPDRRGRLWVTTYYQLVEVDWATGDTRVAPLPWNSDHRFPAGGTVGPDGRIYVGAGDKLLVFDPDEMGGNPNPPETRMVAVEIGGGASAEGRTVEAPFSTAELRLGHRENDVVFRFTGLHYAEPQQMRYEYQLVGFDDAARRGDASGRAVYTNLPPGAYRFRVTARTALGVASPEPATVRLFVAAPWWANPWAYAAYLTLAGGLLAWYVRVVKNRARLAARLEVKSAEASRLQDLDGAKSRFFANISHEFRTPLTLILGQIRAVLDSPERPGNEGRLRMAERSAERAGRMVDQILDLSKLEAGAMELDARVADLVGLVRMRVASFDSLAESRGVGLALGVQRAALPVCYDPEKMEMIVDNLLSNALKFTEPGDSVRVTLRASNRALDRKPLVEMEVADTGVGIPEADLPRIFERFYRVERGERPEGTGAGIGLALTRELVYLHGGDIDATSELGVGTRFVVRLPLVEAAEAETGASGETGGLDLRAPDREHGTAEADAAPPDHEGVDSDEPSTDADDRPLVLVIEDNSDLRAFLRDHLEDEYRLIEAPDGEAGLAAAVDAIPDLVVTDVMMPKLDGYELSRRLRSDARTSHVPIVMLTAKASEASRLEGLETGVDDYLIKPFSRRVLLTRIRSLIELRRVLREKYAGETWLRPEEIEVTPVDRAFLEQVTEAIEGNLSNSAFGVDELAAAVFMSSSQLTRKLRALIDQTPGRLIRAMRLHRAAELIRKNAGSLSRVALESGFSDHAHFSRAFKRQFGCTPSEFRDADPRASEP